MARPKVKQPWHRGTHQVRAKRVTDAANADPSTRCRSCRLTITQAISRWGPKTHWQAGHIIDSLIDGPLEPECSHCNASRGATMGNRNRGRMKRANRLNTSRTW